jgi:hypothetical protein
MSKIIRINDCSPLCKYYRKNSMSNRGLVAICSINAYHCRLHTLEDYIKNINNNGLIGGYWKTVNLNSNEWHTIYNSDTSTGTSTCTNTYTYTTANTYGWR